MFEGRFDQNVKPAALALTEKLTAFGVPLEVAKVIVSERVDGHLEVRDRLLAYGVDPAIAQRVADSGEFVPSGPNSIRPLTEY